MVEILKNAGFSKEEIKEELSKMLDKNFRSSVYSQDKKMIDNTPAGIFEDKSS